MRDVTSLHFLLDTNKLDKYPKGLFLLHADGDVARPDKLRATAKALLMGSPSRSRWWGWARSST